MTRYTFGGYGGDQVTQSPSANAGVFKAAGSLASTGTFWSAQTGGTQYTDLVDPNNAGAPITGVSTDANGRPLAFQGPNGVTEGWLDFGGGRFKIQCVEARDSVVAALVATGGTATDAALKSRYAPKTGIFTVTDPTYGAKADGTTDDGPAFNAAIAACVAAGGGVVYAPAGTYKISTTINLSNIHPSAFHYSTDPGVTLMGAGRHATYLVGGETAYGFIELVGSNRVTVSDMSMTSTGTLQFGILGGRATGDGSSGEHVLKNLIVYGAFTLAAVFMMSSEECKYDRCLIYTTAGKPVVLAREKGSYSATAKYTALSASTTIAGGNGMNYMDSCGILTISTNAADTPLSLEYVQTFIANNLYVYSQNQTTSIYMGKLCFGAQFNALQQEFGTVKPTGLYISADVGGTASSPDYRGIQIRGSRTASVYAENGTRLTEFIYEGSEWRVADTWQIDVDTLYDSRVMYDKRATSVATVVTNPQYRVRTLSRANEWSPKDTAKLQTAPTVTLGTTSGSGGTFTAGTYYWVVTATNTYGQTVASNEVTATLAANGTQVLNWGAVTGATGYKVYRSTSSGVYTGSARVALLGIVTTYTDTGTALAAEAPPTVATAGWPSPAYRGVAAQMFDTFLGKPIWSNGSAWVDATGATV